MTCPGVALVYMGMGKAWAEVVRLTGMKQDHEACMAHKGGLGLVD